jgi:hypothetical protein
LPQSQSEFPILSQIHPTEQWGLPGAKRFDITEPVVPDAFISNYFAVIAAAVKEQKLASMSGTNTAQLHRIRNDLLLPFFLRIRRHQGRFEDPPLARRGVYEQNVCMVARGLTEFSFVIDAECRISRFVDGNQSLFLAGAHELRIQPEFK